LGDARKTTKQLETLLKTIEQIIHQETGEINQIINAFKARNEKPPRFDRSRGGRRLARKAASLNDSEKTQIESRFFRYAYLWNLRGGTLCMLACASYSSNEYERIDRIMARLREQFLKEKAELEPSPFQMGLFEMFKKVTNFQNWTERKQAFRGFLELGRYPQSPLDHGILHWVRFQVEN
ncbi:MAG: hypothetical protein AAF570_09995, partial [Bacteroidota bacterium]